MEGGTGPDLQKSEPKARFDPVTGKPLGSEGIGPAGVASASSPMDENDGRVVEDVPPKIGMGAKILNIFVEPSSVFKNLYYYNDWLTPLVFAGALTIVGSLISKPYNDEAGRQFKELMKVPTTGAAETVGNITSYVTLALVPVGLMIGWLIAAGVLFILGSFMLENVDFKKLYSIAAFSSMPVAFTHIVNAISKFGQTPVIQSYDDFIDAQIPWSISIARVFPAEGLLGKVLEAYDVFAIWGYWLLFLGIAFALRNRAKQAATLTIVYILLWGGITAGLLSLSTLFRPPGL